MAIEFKEITRGRAMVFVRIIIGNELRAKPVTATASTSARQPIPTKIINQGIENELVLVVPQLDVNITATVHIGTEMASLLVNPRHAKHSSQLNTLTRNGRAERVRNADAKVRHSSGNLYTTDVVPDWDTKRLIVRGVVETLVASNDPTSYADVTVTVLGRDGNSVVGADWVSLGDTTSHQGDDNNATLRRIGFSFNLPLDPPDVIIWAKGLSASNGDVFLCLTSSELLSRRDGFAGFTCSAMGDIAYDDWFRSHCATREELALQRTQRFPIEPLFSIVVPLYKTPINLLNEMASSVLCQTYANLELVLVNASPEEASLAHEVQKLAHSDSRVVVVPMEKNLGITENTNAGIAASKGEFVAFLDHDDAVEPNLLFEYVRGINRYPDTDLLYCDEDKLENGRLSWAHFKPDWDPEFLCSLNYITHMLAVRKSVLDRLGGAGREFDGAQDHNLTLKVGEVARNVYHVRKPLYHWRMTSSSTAAKPGAKPYTMVAGMRSVQEHLDRIGVAGKVARRANLDNVYQINFDLPDHPLISIIIPNKDERGVLDRCLSSIRDRTAYDNYEVIVVENNSNDPETFAYYEEAQREDPRVRVVRCETGGVFNYSRLNNYGASQAKGNYLLLLNNDTEVISSDWLEQLVGPCTIPGVGIVGAKLLYPDDTIQHAGIAFHRAGPTAMGLHLPREAFDYNHYYRVMRDTTAVTGACLLTSRKLWDELGGMDEAFAVNYNDVDYCLRAWQHDQRVVYQPAAELYHYESVTRGIEKSREQNLQWKKEEGMLMARYPRYYAEGDPLQNPNVEGPYHHLRW